MLPKSSPIYQKRWGEFAIELEAHNIVDDSGKTVPKRKVFEKLYSEENDIQLSLVVSGMHEKYKLLPRKEFDEAILRQQAIDEITRDELFNRSVKIARRFDIKDSFDEVIKFMVEAMLHALEHRKDIENAVKKQVK